MKKHTVGLTIALVCVACGKPPPDPSTMTMGHKLAELVFDRNLEAAAREVTETERLLAAAAQVMTEPPDKLAEEAWYFTKELRKDSIRESGIDALEVCTRVAERINKTIDFSSCGPLYVVVRHSGMSHTDAVLGVVGLAQAANALVDTEQR
ncbi:hypothetical protein [Burkholderia pseudomallei]|uniref:hypothetical protein n=1 Tax=Burkholderia pseudomallei TaxID=28450 RepID=UPI001EF03092|nr:hypothetical protein [Burkholderia pseudomallei]